MAPWPQGAVMGGLDRSWSAYLRVKVIRYWLRSTVFHPLAESFHIQHTHGVTSRERIKLYKIRALNKQLNFAFSLESVRLKRALSTSIFREKSPASFRIQLWSTAFGGQFRALQGWRRPGFNYCFSHNLKWKDIFQCTQGRFIWKTTKNPGPCLPSVISRSYCRNFTSVLTERKKSPHLLKLKLSEK